MEQIISNIKKGIDDVSNRLGIVNIDYSYLPKMDCYVIYLDKSMLTSDAIMDGISKVVSDIEEAFPSINIFVTSFDDEVFKPELSKVFDLKVKQIDYLIGAHLTEKKEDILNIKLFKDYNSRTLFGVQKPKDNKRIPRFFMSYPSIKTETDSELIDFANSPCDIKFQNALL